MNHKDGASMGARFLGISLVALMVPSVAWAEQAPPATAPAEAERAPPAAAPSEKPTDDREIGEIIVTARRRAESLQSVPVTISVINNEQLTTSNITSALDLGRVAPGLAVTASTNRTDIWPS